MAGLAFLALKLYVLTQKLLLIDQRLLNIIVKLYLEIGKYARFLCLSKHLIILNPIQIPLCDGNTLVSH